MPFEPDEPSPLDPAGRRTSLGGTLRVIATIALLGVLVWKLRDEQISALFPKKWGANTIAWLLGGVATCFVGFGLSARRWQLVLRALGHRVPLPTLFSNTLAGQFAGNALPSTIGGDAVRMSRVRTNIGSSSDAFASVIIERLTGWIALPAWCALGFVLDPGLLDRSQSRLAVITGATTFGVLLSILFLAGHPKLAGRFAQHENWMRFVGAVHIGVDALRRQPRLTAHLLATAFAYQLTTLAMFACGFGALGVADVDLAVMLAYFPTVTMLQVLPITVGGLGMRENTLAFLFKPFGVGTAPAFGTGLLWYAFTLVASLAGLGPFSRKPRSHE